MQPNLLSCHSLWHLLHVRLIQLFKADLMLVTFLWGLTAQRYIGILNVFSISSLLTQHGCSFVLVFQFIYSFKTSFYLQIHSLSVHVRALGSNRCPLCPWLPMIFFILKFIYTFSIFIYLKLFGSIINQARQWSR